MKVDIKNVEKTQGLVFKKKLYGVQTTVTFTEEEKAIIKERNLTTHRILEREWSADIDAEAKNNRGIVSKIATGVMKGASANSPSLFVATLLRGPDTYYMTNTAEAKVYIDELKEELTTLKRIIEASAQAADDSSFEL